MATLEGHRDLMADCADRILFCGPSKPIGFGQFSGYQLKIIQEAVTLMVFIVFAANFLKEKLAWNYIVSFALLIVAAIFAFAFKPNGSGS